MKTAVFHAFSRIFLVFGELARELLLMLYRNAGLYHVFHLIDT